MNWLIIRQKLHHHQIPGHESHFSRTMDGKFKKFKLTNECQVSYIWCSVKTSHNIKRLVYKLIMQSYLIKYKLIK